MQRIALLASALLVAAMLLVSAALAERPDDRAGTIGVGSVTASAADPARPDDRAGLRGPGAVAVSSKQTISSAVRPDDRPDARGPGAITAGPTTILVSSDGFDWSDAGVGLAGGIGLALLAAGLLATVTHRQRMHRVA